MMYSWIGQLTMYLMDGSVGDGRYTYKNYPDAPQVTATESISSCPQSLSRYGQSVWH